eukprot:SAG31_NODE_9062_length_1341_cov_1.778583_1_plen_57_part_10
MDRIAREEAPRLAQQRTECVGVGVQLANSYRVTLFSISPGFLGAYMGDSAGKSPIKS